MSRNNPYPTNSAQEPGSINPITGAINPYPSSDKRIYGGGVYGSPP
jgi:hypothetical protein